MPDSAVIPGTTTYRMSSLAWAMAVQSATETLRLEDGVDLAGSTPGPGAAILAGLDDLTRAGIARELNTAGITDSAGRIRPQWLQALGQGATAPIRLSLVARSAGASTHCRVNLFDGRGLAVEFTRPVATAADGKVAAASVADAVTVTLLPEAVLWPVMARSMPPFPELTTGAAGPDAGSADSGPVPGRDGGKTTLSAADATALARGGSDDIPPGVAAAVAAAKATVYLDVQSQAAGTGLPYRAAGVWALSDSLYSVRTTGPAGARRLVMVEAASGDIARQLVWHTVGAHEFLARRTSAEPAS
ncbi:hypothetical protein [Pseudarthrobacter sp. ATCC 49987]|uniref:hypothetical protein n=1 Tax=Pseudarthrobacter sp. ATCC 49987 TaxID=2698204 RepID=UPI001371CD38|nr:hypothetical protein [Pseudarthrobacter sp. ATCC 49987]